MNEQKHVDPTGLGLFGLALVTLLSSTEKLGFTSGVVFMIPWALLLGSLAQIIAGIFDFKKGNAFGGTAFIGFGLFWSAVALTWFFTIGGISANEIQLADAHQLAFAFVGYLVFSLFLTIAASETNFVLFLIFIFIDLLFLGLSLSTFGVMPDTTLKFAGVAELLVSIFSFYGFGANIINNHFGRTVLPIGKGLGLIKKA